MGVDFLMEGGREGGREERNLWSICARQSGCMFERWKEGREGCEYHGSANHNRKCQLNTTPSRPTDRLSVCALATFTNKQGQHVPNRERAHLTGTDFSYGGSLYYAALCYGTEPEERKEGRKEGRGYLRI